jgi:hypothetical protein
MLLYPVTRKPLPPLLCSALTQENEQLNRRMDCIIVLLIDQQQQSRPTL